VKSTEADRPACLRCLLARRRSRAATLQQRLPSDRLGCRLLPALMAQRQAAQPRLPHVSDSSRIRTLEDGFEIDFSIRISPRTIPGLRARSRSPHQDGSATEDIEGRSTTQRLRA